MLVHLPLDMPAPGGKLGPLRCQLMECQLDDDLQTGILELLAERGRWVDIVVRLGGPKGRAVYLDRLCGCASHSYFQIRLTLVALQSVIGLPLAGKASLLPTGGPSRPDCRHCEDLSALTEWR